MKARAQISLDRDVERRARERARSFSEYVRLLVLRDLSTSPVNVFDLGASGGSDISRHKDAMIAEAMAPSASGKRRS